MFCHNCGAQVNGSFCNNCGTPVTGTQAQAQVVMPQPVDTGVKLLISRVKSFVGCAVALDVTVNGVLYNLSNDQQFFVYLQPGVNNVITYKVWCRGLKTINIMAQAGRTYELKFKPDWLLGGFKIDKSSILQ